MTPGKEQVYLHHMNSGEKNLQKLLKEANPLLNRGQYVFVTVNDNIILDKCNCIMQFQEQEGTALILNKNEADSLNLEYNSIFAWITLQVHSSLDAVGLTAAFSKALANNNISCNVVAGFYHDHIFVNYNIKDKAMDVLSQLSSKS